MRMRWGARQATQATMAVLAVWLAGFSGVGCSSSKGLPGAGSGGAGASGGAAGQGGGEATDAAADRPEAGAVGGQPASADAGDALGDASPNAGGLPGLVSIDVTPSSQTVALVASGTSLTGSATFTATGQFSDGHSEDVTSRVSWPSDFASLQISAGNATVLAPGTYAIRAISGSLSGTATLVATFKGNLLGPGFDPSSAAILDGTPTGETTIAYPLNGALVPPNLSPLPVHTTRTAGQSMARLRFTVGAVLDVSYYALCQSGAGSGCYVDLPPDLTHLFVAPSETSDITLTARVGGPGEPLNESAPIQLAWPNVPLSGGLYYWTTLAPGFLPGYMPPTNADGSSMASGAGVQRYDFAGDGAALPELVYTDKGRAPAFLGSPPATTDGAQCIGCHAISGNGKTMALTIGGSGAPDFALLDLPTLTMTVLDAGASAGVVSTSDPKYYRQFRKSGVAAETAFGPNGDVMVNMYMSKLFLRGTTASLINEGEVAAKFPDLYKTDPFWSASGKYFVFTSFAVPDAAPQYYNPTGLNGDMKRNGQIAIASASASGINDDAHVLVSREPNITKYYPAVSDDDALVVYDQSTCGLDPDVYTNVATGAGIYGAQTCDGYDDSSAALWLTSTTGMTPMRLDRLNGGPNVTSDNSRPQWSPTSGTFRGQRLYWLAFSSRRAYGLQVNSGTLPIATRAQLWLGGVLIGNELVTDPSFAPVWVPNQNPTPVAGVPNQTPADNHTPQWARAAVPLP